MPSHYRPHKYQQLDLAEAMNFKSKCSISHFIFPTAASVFLIPYFLLCTLVTLTWSHQLATLRSGSKITALIFNSPILHIKKPTQTQRNQITEGSSRTDALQRDQNKRSKTQFPDSRVYGLNRRHPGRQINWLCHPDIQCQRHR